MFENLKKAIDRSEKERTKKAHDRASADDSALRELLTGSQWAAYVSGMLTQEDTAETRSKALELARKKSASQEKKRADRFRERLTAAEESKQPARGLLVIRWVRNSTWGWNPHAVLYVAGETFTGRASGCGYDKASAAMAEALNACPAIMRRVYAREDKRPEGVARRAWLGYGSGYGTLPAFEGGVGVRTLCEVLTACGFCVDCTQARDKTYFVRIE